MTFPATRTTCRFATLAVLVAVAGAGFVTSVAAANPPGPHDPTGKVESITAAGESVHVTGWAADPDSSANIRLFGITDGKRTVSAITSIARSDIAKAHHTGPTAGFSIDIPVPSTGVHTVCVLARNVGAGLGRLLRCITTPLGTRLTAAQKRAHDPSGAVLAATASAATMTVSGWSTDPDYHDGRMRTVLYVDGIAAQTVVTGRSTAAERKAGAGRNGAFRFAVPVSGGAHLGCVWLVNSGIGRNVALGCRAVDTRGIAGAGALPAPAVNAKVVREAKRHIGQPYVWGAAGPKKFDCSGLVMYSYHKAGVSTPRVAAAQFAAARVIPAARAVAGDLVFYHDSTGSVYHVGIYLAPGDTVAAIDEQEGIAHQQIWDPASATYGSFTHI